MYSIKPQSDHLATARKIAFVIVAVSILSIAANILGFLIHL